MRTIQKFMIEHALYPAMERFRGNQIRAKTERLRASDRLPADQLRKMQAQQLAALLEHCAEYVPAYHALGWDIAEIRHDPFAFLAGVPVLPKTAFQTMPKAYLSNAADLSTLIPNRTGGSTGEPVHFYMTRGQVEAYEAARWRGLSWFGITPGSRCVMIWGNPIELTQNAQRKYQLRERMLKNRIIVSAYQLSSETVPAKAAAIERYRPEYLYGYSSALTLFAEMMLKAGVSLKLQLKAVVSTAETLTEAQKKTLEAAFHCPIANEYGARDAGILAYSCPEGHLHITAENSLIEVLDPVTHAPLPTGRTGVLAVTDLGNFAQPRLRYLLGDVGSLAAVGCKCGRTLPLLGTLEGREDAMLVGADGQLVHGNAIGQLIRRYDGVRQFRFIQHTPEQATLLLALASPGSAPSMQIVSEVQSLFPDAEIQIKIVDSIPPAASGKMRYTIREFPLHNR